MSEKAPKGPHFTFATQLRAAMSRAGLKGKDVCLELGIDDETVRLWRNGERMPRDAKLKRLAKMVGVEPAVLRYGDAGQPATMPTLKGEHVTDDDELSLLRAYRGLKREWAREALRRRAVELLEEFGEPGASNPWAKAGRPGTQ